MLETNSERGKTVTLFTLSSERIQEPEHSGLTLGKRLCPQYMQLRVCRITSYIPKALI